MNTQEAQQFLLDTLDEIIAMSESSNVPFQLKALSSIVANKYPTILDKLEDFVKILCLLEDAESQVLGKKIIAYYLSMGSVAEWLTYHPFFTDAEWNNFGRFQKHYNYQDLIKVEPGDVVLDIGAFTGDTAVDFSPMAGDKGLVFSFEVDPVNFEKLNETIKAKNLDNVRPINKAVSDKNGFLHFALRASSISVVVETGGTEVPALSLDSWAEAEHIEKIDFIKMDIEGAELSAITGAEKIIKRFHPKMALCVYHKVDDFFTIPEKVLSINPNYKLYLKHNSVGHIETVMFFLPSNEPVPQISVPDLSTTKAFYRYVRKTLLAKNRVFFDKIILLLNEGHKKDGLSFPCIFDQNEVPAWMRIPFSSNKQDVFIVELNNDSIIIKILLIEAFKNHTEQERADIAELFSRIKAKFGTAIITIGDGAKNRNLQLHITFPRVEDQAPYTASVLNWLIGAALGYLADKGLLSGPLVVPFL